MTTCPKHPTYKTIKPPTSDCKPCLRQYDAAHPEDGGAAPSLDAFAAEAEAGGKVAELTKRASRLQDDLRIAKARAEAAEKRQHEAERIRENIFRLTEKPLITPKWAIEQSKASGAPHVAVLLASDFQLGEVVLKENLDGVNEFNTEIAKKRYKMLIEKTIDISFEHLPKNKYSGIVYARLGDMISGGIHEELRETDDQSRTESVRTLVEMETWGINKLADAFGQVHIPTVPGNHGRLSLKPPTKRVAETNLDTMSGWWLEQLFKSDSRITWQTPNSTDAVVNIHGRQYLFSHGDNLGSRGGQGFVGPAATITRGFKKVMDEYARRGTILQAVACGHFHTALDLGYGWCNGSLPGYSEYARMNRMMPEPPQMWLLMMHPKYGPTSQWKIRLEADPSPARYSTPFTK